MAQSILNVVSTTNNKERQQQVDFSVGFFEVGSRLLTATDSGVKDFADLKGKKLVNDSSEQLSNAISVSMKRELGIGEVISCQRPCWIILDAPEAVVLLRL